MNKEIIWNNEFIKEEYLKLFRLIDAGAKPKIKILTEEGNEITNGFIFRAYAYRDLKFSIHEPEFGEVFEVSLEMDLDLQAYNTQIAKPEYYNNTKHASYTYFEAMKPKHGVYYDCIMLGTIGDEPAIELVDSSPYLKEYFDSGAIYHMSYVAFLEKKIDEHNVQQ